MAINFSPQQQIDIDSIYLYRKDWKDEQRIDIKSIVQETLIYEDILSPSITAIMNVGDHLNIADNMPILGGERITIKFRTPSYPDYTTKDFVIKQVGDTYPSKDNSRGQVYSWHLVTVDAYTAAYTPISAAFQGSYDEIITKVLKRINSTTDLYSDPSLGVVKYVAPNWNALKICSYIATRSHGNKFEPFFFYEDLDSYNFASSDTIFNQESVATYFLEPKQTQDMSEDIEKSFRSIYDWNYLPRMDKEYLNNIGAFGGFVYTYDPILKQYSKSSFNYSDRFGDDKLPVIDTYHMYDDVSSSDRKTMNYFNKKSDNSDLGGMVRKTTFSLMNSTRLKVVVNGDSQLRVGSIIELSIPSKQMIDLKYEQTTSGRWLITSLKHIIRPDHYSMTLEISKDSYATDIASNVK